MSEQESKAYDDLAKLSLADNPTDTNDSGNSYAMNSKENINVVFIGHVGKPYGWPQSKAKTTL